MHAVSAAGRVQQQAGSSMRVVRDPCAIVERQRGAGRVGLRRGIRIARHHHRKSTRREQRTQPEGQRQGHILLHGGIADLRSAVDAAMRRIEHDHLAVDRDAAGGRGAGARGALARRWPSWRRLLGAGGDSALPSARAPVSVIRTSRPAVADCRRAFKRGRRPSGNYVRCSLVASRRLYRSRRPVANLLIANLAGCPELLCELDADPAPLSL